MNDINFLVRVTCMTYNHAPYIVDAMNGFTMQETTFPFICVIIDDASTDGEPEVIRQYLHDNFELDDALITQQDETEDFVRVFSRHKNNLNCYFLVVLLKYNHYSLKKSKSPYFIDRVRGIKYIATCEGDDFWIDSKKLCVQVQFMETHQEYGLIRTNVNKLCQRNGTIQEKVFSSLPYSNIKDSHTDYIINGWFLAPCTWLYRVDAVKNTPKLDSNVFFTGDLNTALVISKYYKIKYLDNVTAVYRELEKSASHFASFQDLYRFKKKMRMIRIYYALNQSFNTRLKCWYMLCCQRRPPFHEWKYFPQWVSICLESFEQLFLGRQLK